MHQRLALALLLLSLPLRAEEPPASAPLTGAHFFLGPSLQLVPNFGGGGPFAGPPVALALQAMVDTGAWMLGGELRAGIARSPSLFLHATLRLDRHLQDGPGALYAGAGFGFLDEFDGENYGGEGASATAQVGYLWGRDRRWGRAAVELQLTVPFFGERPNKPGNYVYPFVSLGLRLFL